MYTAEEKRRAVELFIQYDCSCMAVINELGYPCRDTLYKWHREYAETGCVGRRNPGRYTDRQKRDAVEHYISHGKCNARTRRALGYPGSYEQLAAWVDEYAPGARRTRKPAGSYTDEERKEAVIDLVAREIPAGEVAAAHGVTRATLYQWKRLLVGKEPIEMKKPGLPDDPGKLAEMVVDLQEQVRKLQLRKDVLEGTVELLGKGRGADPNRLTNREKTVLVEALRRNHRLKDVLEAVGLARSSHQYQLGAMRRPDKYAALRADIRRIFAASDGTYGYRRMHIALAAEGTRVSEKVVSRIMREERLDARRCRKRRRWSSYAGEISEAPENLVGRDFHADAPNKLWLTDITEFRIPAGKVYLSPLIDCFDGMVVSWSMSTSPDAELANTMLESAVRTLHDGERPVVHDDRGCHYRWPGWVAICEENGLVRSMSRKGCSPDDSAMEGFSGRMKVEMFYGRSWRGVSIGGFMDAVDAYIRWYNSDRIKVTLDGMSPMQYRESLGIAAWDGTEKRQRPQVSTFLLPNTNGHARTLPVDSAWHHARSYTPASPTAVADAAAAVAEAASRANRRLHERCTHLRSHGRPANVVNAAIARELAGFAWALANLAA